MFCPSNSSLIRSSKSVYAMSQYHGSHRLSWLKNEYCNRWWSQELLESHSRAPGLPPVSLDKNVLWDCCFKRFFTTKHHRWWLSESTAFSDEIAFLIWRRWKWLQDTVSSALTFLSKLLGLFRLSHELEGIDDLENYILFTIWLLQLPKRSQFRGLVMNCWTNRSLTSRLGVEPVFVPRSRVARRLRCSKVAFLFST